MPRRFFVLGPQKTATTWLHRCLQEHPQIFVPPAVKETFFFDKYYDRGIDWYERYFRGAQRFPAAGEVAPTYFGHPAVPRRIASAYPEAALIVCLRHPVERARSCYLHFWGLGLTAQPFDQAIIQFPQIVEDGLYARHLRSYRDHFPESHITNIVYDDIVRDASDSFHRLLAFLGVSSEFVVDSLTTRVNESKNPRARWLTHAMMLAGGWLHSKGLHNVVKVGKAVGLRRMLYRPDKKPSFVFTDEQKRRLIDYYRNDTGELGLMLGRNFSQMWFNKM